MLRRDLLVKAPRWLSQDYIYQSLACFMILQEDEYVLSPTLLKPCDMTIATVELANISMSRNGYLCFQPSRLLAALHSTIEGMLGMWNVKQDVPRTPGPLLRPDSEFQSIFTQRHVVLRCHDCSLARVVAM